MTEGKSIGSASVEDVANTDVAEAIVVSDAYVWDIRGAIAANVVVEDITCVAKALREGVVGVEREEMPAMR